MTDNALAIIEEKNVATYFRPQGLDPVLDKIRAEVKGVVLDISTKEGRKQIASLAYKVAKTKTALDEIGKKLTEDQKKQIKAVDAERKRAWDALEELQKEVRAPLTEWEEREEKRVAAHETALAAIPEHPSYGHHETSTELTERLDHLESLPPHDWEEFKDRAARVLADEITRTKNLLAAARTREAEKAELERLREEQAARERKEREDRIAAEAAEKARKEAEQAALKVAEEEAARVKAEQEKAEQERLRLQREAEEAAAREEAAKREATEAEERARIAEEDRFTAIAQAEADRIAAAEQAERDRKEAEEAAAKRERDRIAAEQRQREEEAAKREADKVHRGKINREALAAFVAAGVAEEVGKLVIGAIAKGEIPTSRLATRTAYDAKPPPDCFSSGIDSRLG